MRSYLRPQSAVALLTAVAIVAIVLATAVVIIGQRSREIQHGRLETRSLAQMLLEQTEQTFEGVDLLLSSVQERLEAGYGRELALDSAPVHLLLSTRAGGAKQVLALFLADSSGNTVNSSRPSPMSGISVANREYFKALAHGKDSDVYVDKPVRSLVDGDWTLHVARRISHRDGSLRGVLVARINLDYLVHLYSYMKLDFVRPISLYTASGSLIASLPRREASIGDRAEELGSRLPPIPESEVRLLSHASGDGTRVEYALGRVKGFPLLVGVTNVEDDVLASWRETSVPIILGACLVCLFIGLAGLLLASELQRGSRLTQALSDAENRHRRTVDSMMDAVVAVDEAQKIIMFNPAAERMFGLPAAKAIGSPLDRLIPDSAREAHRRHLDAFSRSAVSSRGMAPLMNVMGLRADGSRFPIESAISQITIDGKPQLTAVLRDITERQRAEAELREANRQLHELSAALQEVRENERSRISRELHDELGQQLTGLNLEMSWLTARVRDGRGIAPGDMDGMRSQIETAIGTVKRISTELRPPVLDDLGFSAAVAWQVGEFTKRSAVKVDLDLAAAGEVEGPMATALFRIVQESLTNIARHSDATRAGIRLAATQGGLALTISDDGKGLPADGPGPGGVGLLSMRERATSLGGTFDISSGPGGGTTISVTVPLGEPALAEARA
jgi:PAS domain S-box-containing protein